MPHVGSGAYCTLDSLVDFGTPFLGWGHRRQPDLVLVHFSLFYVMVSLFS